MLKPVFKIQVVWTSTIEGCEGWVNGLRFTITIDGVKIITDKAFSSGKKKALYRLNQFKKAVETTPQYKTAIRVVKSYGMKVSSLGGNSYAVENLLNNNIYNVITNPNRSDATCNCSDYYYRQQRCKHIMAVIPDGDKERGTGRIVPFRKPVKKDISASEAKDSLGL